MRKDKLSSFQAKKQKLQKIKYIIHSHYINKTLTDDLQTEGAIINAIWEIIKNEK